MPNNDTDKSNNELALIPGGEFLMGSDSGADRSPARKVFVDPFYLDKRQVRNKDYISFCEEAGHRPPFFWKMTGFRCGPDFPNHPVVGVNWLDASEYAAWHELRLPTEAEWEYAARGGLAGKDFPHGDTLDPSNGNYSKADNRGTMEVGSYPPNGFGLFDMQGNVVEWVADFYGFDYYSVSPSKNPTGPELGKFRCIRGGGWHSGPMCQKVYFRNALPPGWLDFNVGFRCAGDIDR